MGNKWRQRSSVMLLAACGVSALACASNAQEIPAAADSTLSETMYFLSPRPVSSRNPLLRPGRYNRGITAGQFILYPSLLAGAVIDDNLSWSSRKPKTAAGVRIRPELLAIRDTGKHKTFVYGDVDARFFPSMSRGNTISGKAALAHHWEIQHDLFFKAHAGFTRKASYVSGGTVRAPSGATTTLVSPQYTNVALAALALQKTFGRIFTGISGKFQHTQYSDLDTATGIVPQSFRDNYLAGLNFRAGVWFAPVLYGFAEASADFRKYSNSSATSQGQSIVAGIGSDRISLFRGEVFAGVQRQTFSQPTIANSNNPLFGGKIYWFPTRAWIIGAKLQQDYSDTSAATPGNPGGFPKRTTSLGLDIKYKMSRHWSASLRSGYARSSYQSNIRRDQAWYAGSTFTYELTRNAVLTLDLDHYRLNSNDRTAAYTHTIYKLGAKYRY